MRLHLLALAAAVAMSIAPGAGAAARVTIETRNIVLLQGTATDAGGWQRVQDVLEKDGYRVSVVRTAATSLPENVSITRHAIARQHGPVVLVGHSADGAVITEAGNDPRVVGLVYIAALAPDAGESARALPDGFASMQPGADSTSTPTADASKAEPASRPYAGTDAITSPAWKIRPSLYLVATGDPALPEHAQRAMARRAGSIVVAVSGDQPIYVSTPVTVAKVIEQGAHVDQAAVLRAKALAMAGID